ncbi:MAG TPA: toll/interleukin-1 receptor domain-containing protein [Anaerolineales bacterium]|nr:toll/interleukin-1 receptor domain-containing protein [Anaerolineales bacterium]
MGHIFISYSHKDTTYAHGLADHLRTMGFDIWMDESLDYGSQWPHAIQKHLDSCDAFILIMTPRSFASDWVQSELQRAKRKRKPVYPLLLEGDEPWLSVESTQYYDVRNRELPDDEFYSDLKQVVSAEQTISHSRGFDNRTKSVSRLWPAGKTGYVVIGFLITIMSVCLVSAVLLLQRAAGSIAPLGTTTLPMTHQSTASSPITTKPALTPLPVHLPDGSEVTMFAPAGGEFRYTILSAWWEPSSPGKHLLHLRLRVWTDSITGVNFWSDSFRLVVGDHKLAPVNDLNLVARRDETVDGDVEFEIDASLQEAVLVINVGRIPDAWATKELHLVFP